MGAKRGRRLKARKSIEKSKHPSKVPWHPKLFRAKVVLNRMDLNTEIQDARKRLKVKYDNIHQYS